MSVVSLFRHRGSAPVARERLQILLSHERAAFGRRDLLTVLQEEILAAVAKHVMVNQDNVQIQMDRGADGSKLEIGVEIPHSAPFVRMAVASHQPDK
jgi:cell division topological specificity factor